MEAGGWAIRIALFLIEFGFRYLSIPHAAWHTVQNIAAMNDQNWPIVTLCGGYGTNGLGLETPRCANCTGLQPFETRETRAEP